MSMPAWLISVSKSYYPAGTRRNNNVFTTSTRRRRRRVDVVKTLSLRHYCVMCPLGIIYDRLRILEESMSVVMVFSVCAGGLVPLHTAGKVMPNYVNPICCVATVCHQVRCMYWGHLGHFQRAISHLKWYNIVCMRYLACTFCQMKSIKMFSMFLQSGVLRYFLWRLIAV